MEYRNYKSFNIFITSFFILANIDLLIIKQKFVIKNIIF